MVVETKYKNIKYEKFSDTAVGTAAPGTFSNTVVSTSAPNTFSNTVVSTATPTNSDNDVATVSKTYSDNDVAVAAVSNKAADGANSSGSSSITSSICIFLGIEIGRAHV